MSNWDIPREEAIKIVVNLRRRGYAINDVARHVTQKHYCGVSYDRAAALLARDSVACFWTEHAGRTEEQDKIAMMAEELRSEGWVMVNPPGFGYLWYHKQTHVDVNRGGGTFSTFEAATIAVYQSATRKIVSG